MADELTPESTPTPTGPEPTPAPTDAPPTPPPAPETPPAEPAPGEPAEPTARRTADDRVPYPVFRRAQTEATQARRELERRRSEFDQLRGRSETLEQTLQREREELEDHRALAQIVREDPELYDTVATRLRTRLTPRDGGGGPPRAPAAPGGGGGRENELATLVRENNEFIREERARLNEEREHTRKTRLYGTVNDQVTGLLKRAGYDDPALLPKLAPTVIDFIVKRGEEVFDDTGTVEDVPWLFNQWLEVQLTAEQMRDKRRIAARTADAARPTPIPGSPAAPGAPQRHPIGSPEVRQQAAALLRQHGWNDAA